MQHCELHLHYGMDAIAAEIYRLQDVFLSELTHAFVRCSRRRCWTPILSLLVPGDVNALRRALLKQHVICTERGGYLRIAPHFYNTDEEVERAAHLINTMIY